MNGLVLTRAALLQLAGFKPVEDLKRSRRATLRALSAKSRGYVDGAGQEHPPAPDHAVRIKAAEQFYKLYDAFPRPDSGAGDPSRPVNVSIILTGTNGASTGADLSTHGIKLHLSDGNGGSA